MSNASSVGFLYKELQVALHATIVIFFKTCSKNEQCLIGEFYLQGAASCLERNQCTLWVLLAGVTVSYTPFPPTTHTHTLPPKHTHTVWRKTDTIATIMPFLSSNLLGMWSAPCSGWEWQFWLLLMNRLNVNQFKTQCTTVCFLYRAAWAQMDLRNKWGRRGRWIKKYCGDIGTHSPQPFRKVAILVPSINRLLHEKGKKGKCSSTKRARKEKAPPRKGQERKKPLLEKGKKGKSSSTKRARKETAKRVPTWMSRCRWLRKRGARTSDR